MENVFVTKMYSRRVVVKQKVFKLVSKRGNKKYRIHLETEKCVSYPKTYINCTLLKEKHVFSKKQIQFTQIL